MLALSILNSPSLHCYWKIYVLFSFDYLGVTMPILSLFFKELFSFSFRSGISCYLCLKFRNFSRICQDSSYQPCKELIHPFNYEEFIFPPLRENFSYCWIVTSSPSFPLSLFGVLINCILKRLGWYSNGFGFHHDFQIFIINFCV